MGRELGEGGCWEGRHGGGAAPKFLAECCAHTPYLSWPCLCSHPGREGGLAAPTGVPQLPSLPSPLRL